MVHYRSDVRDIDFHLFDVMNVGAAQDVHDVLDRDGVGAMLRELDRLAAGPIAASYVTSDRVPPTFDPTTHEVVLPEDFKDSVRAYIDGGWAHVGAAPEVGGTPVPRVVFWALAELVLAANPAVFMYASAPTSASIFHRQATGEQKRWAELLGTNNWGSTMVLTEPDAGSDVGSARTKAIAQDDGTWHIEGVKRFITSGDAGDLFDNVVHFVLARPEGARPGTKGLSLFMVPKYHFDFENGVLGDRNGVFVTNLEHKMGLKASATCELTFGSHEAPAVGWLVGEVHDGIAQMFETIEHARMFVGTKSIAAMSTGYLNALEYARVRVQGADLAAPGASAPRVPIIQHADVRRSLLTQKAYVEGLRGLYLYAAAHQDPEVALVVSGADATTAAAVSDLLLPVVKGVGSESSIAMLSQSLQILGGSGYLQDYPIEQYVRDSRIDAIYEGTTAIQAQDFLFRKVVRDGGATLDFLFGRAEREIEAAVNPSTKFVGERLAVALADLRALRDAIVDDLVGAMDDARRVHRVALNATGLLKAVGDVFIGWMLLWQANAAAAVLDGDGPTQRFEAEFYEGKLQAASFFAGQVLPAVGVARQKFENSSLAVMDMSDRSF